MIFLYDLKDPNVIIESMVRRLRVVEEELRERPDSELDGYVFIIESVVDDLMAYHIGMYGEDSPFSDVEFPSTAELIAASKEATP
ncbi:hypothetical protein [Desulfatiglans anilini]|uniref:hypothetical protein n=1 Tax=Desulfatiglans anilini TaxID=90728 RepID=UPI000414FAF2|nr:hypothetical protein [Desulfatiglans anilini]